MKFKASLIISVCFLFLFCNGKNELIAGSKETKYTKMSSKQGWTNYVISDAIIFRTEDWHSFKPSEEYIDFFISFPSSWKIGYSVIYNENNNKIAEFLPGIVLNEGIDFYDKIGKVGEKIEGNMGYTKYLSKEKFRIDNKLVYLVVEECPAFGDNGPIIWYPNAFYIQNEKYILVILLYYENNIAYDKELVSTIIRSFRIVK